MKLSDRDLETLSAYLDGEISSRDRERLEARLHSDPALQEYLVGLQRTRAAVRSLPKLRAPRSYYLTPEMVGQKRRSPRLFPVFSFASAVATVLFVLLLLGDYIMVSTPALAPLRALEASGTVRQVLESPLTVPSELESKIPEELADEFFDRSAAEERAPAEAPIAPETEAEGLEVPEAAAEALEALPGIGELFATGEPDIQTEAEGAVESIAEPAQEEGIQAQGRAIVTPLLDDIQPLLPLWGILRSLEVVMIILAISTGIAAFILYRKK
jgi:anti-sigma factor RsiW